MDWITAWQAALPVYAFAVVLHAFLPLFALPVWVIFYLYGRKILDGARAAERPWRGRGSPKPYLVAGPLAFGIQIAGIATFAAGGPVSGAVTGTVAGIGSLVFPALFLSATAPPGARDRQDLLRVGLLCAFASSLVAPAVLFGALPLAGGGAALVYAAQIGLAAASAAAFFAAKRFGPARAPGVARKVPRG
jgi:hypothetical protein